MQKVAIVTSSGHGLTKALIDEYDIKLFPFPIFIENKSYLDGIDITPDEILKAMYQGKIPKTSAPSPADLINIFKPLIDEGKSIIVILMSAGLSSATLEAARRASEELGGDIEIIDSRQIAGGQEIIALEAARIAKEGKSKSEIVEYVKKIVPRTNSIFGIPDLMYLYHGGRIGRAKALMGSMMKVIPIVAVRDMEGIVSPIGRARNVPQVNERIVEVIKKDLEKFEANKIKTFIIGHADNEQAALELKEALEKNFDYGDMFILPFGCVATVYPGPKSWGVAYCIE